MARTRRQRPGTQPGEHVVKLYTDEDDLADVVGDYLTHGANAGWALVVVADPKRATRFLGGVKGRRNRTRRLEKGGRLHVFDARATLERIMVDGMPAREGFAAAVADPIRALVADDRFEGVCAYGEMVDILWCEGWLPAALALEELWNELIDETGITLLCAYSMSLVGDDWTSAAANAVLACHTPAIPDGDRTALDQAVDLALDDVFGMDDAARVRQSIQAEGPKNGRTGAAEHALGWLHEHAPQQVRPVLDLSRRRLEAPR